MWLLQTYMEERLGIQQKNIFKIYILKIVVVKDFLDLIKIIVCHFFLSLIQETGLYIINMLSFNLFFKFFQITSPLSLFKQALSCKRWHCKIISFCLLADLHKYIANATCTSNASSAFDPKGQSSLNPATVFSLWYFL